MNISFPGIFLLTFPLSVSIINRINDWNAHGNLKKLTVQLLTFILLRQKCRGKDLMNKKETLKRGLSVKTILFIQMAVIIYTLSSVCSKNSRKSYRFYPAVRDLCLGFELDRIFLVVSGSIFFRCLRHFLAADHQALPAVCRICQPGIRDFLDLPMEPAVLSGKRAARKYHRHPMCLLRNIIGELRCKIIGIPGCFSSRYLLSSRHFLRCC